MNWEEDTQTNRKRGRHTNRPKERKIDRWEEDTQTGRKDRRCIEAH